MNEVWERTAEFIARLNGEHVHRKSYVRTPEYILAEQEWANAEEQWQVYIGTLSEEQKQFMEDYKEKLEVRSYAEEKRAYTQGYVDCIQILAKMGLLVENPDLKIPNFVK